MIDPTNEIAPSAVSPDDMQTQADQASDPLHDLVPVMAFESLPGQLTSIESVGAPEFSQALLALRKVYEAQGLKRQQFNAMVCDELARRGESPSGAAVLKVARWGSNGDVIEDVSKWYSSLAQRLSERHAHIPDAVQHKASKLFEALWEHAATQIAAPLRDQMAAQKIVFDEETLRMKAQIALEAALADKRDQDQQSSIASLSQDLQKACLDAEGKAMRISAMELDLANSQTSLAVAERALVAAQQDYMRRISDAQAKALAEQAASQAVHDAIVQGLQAQLARLEADLSQQRKDGALAIDQARQDAKDAHKRADAAQRNVDGLLVEASALKDRLSEQTIEMARLQRDIAQAGERVTAAERLSEDLRGQLAASQESLATLAKGALISKKERQ